MSRLVLSAILGDFGSCDYAIGNRFEMAYAQYRNTLQAQGKRTGKAVVINWPLWKDGGMGLEKVENAASYLKSSGQRCLEIDEGLKIFETLICQKASQHLVIMGEPRRVYSYLGLSKKTLSPGHNKHSISVISKKKRLIEMRGLSVGECLELDLKEHISQLLKIPRKNLDAENNLADFGFDSIGLTKLSYNLSEYFGFEITPSVFFGHSTLDALCKYFLQKHLKAIEAFYQITTNLNEESIEQLESQNNHSKNNHLLEQKLSTNSSESIAIIGMSGRFPHARTIEEMWDILSEARNVVEVIPEERFNWQKHYGDSTQDSAKTNCKWSGFIPGVQEFDPLFFEISPQEAEHMDPRQRHLLQESWKALEDAGYGMHDIQTQQIGMFVGVEEGDYGLINSGGNITSQHNGILAARLAYFLNLQGPTMAINTACSSSLVAMHQAISSLRNGDCSTAIVAGVNLMLSPKAYIAMGQAGMLSSDGKCFAFDKRANGMVPGEAVAVVILKSLSQAKLDNNQIHAIIKGSGINSDGKTNGITAPNGVAQTNLIKKIYDQNQINPEDIDYIVTHGTGTKLGDPVEVNALYDAFKHYTQKQNYCALTSTKTNFGHTFAASGLLSVISLVEAMKHKIIPASLHCEQENEHILWKNSPFYVNKAKKLWSKSSEKERTGAVSAFGMSGTNAHVVLQSYAATEKHNIEKFPYYLLPISAKTLEALHQKVQDMIDFLQKENKSDMELTALSYTLQQGRHHFLYRCAIIIENIGDAIHMWQAYRAGEKYSNILYGQVYRGFKERTAIKHYVNTLLSQSCCLKQEPRKYQETLCALGDFYCQGYDINWDILYSDKPQKITLPTYPFAKECYWTDNSKQKVNTNSLVVKNQPVVMKKRELSQKSDIISTLLFKPKWKEQNVLSIRETLTYTEHYVFLCNMLHNNQYIKSKNFSVIFTDVESNKKMMDKQFEDASLQLFKLVKKILKVKTNGKILLQVIVPKQGPEQVFQGLSGLLKTAQLENPKLLWQVICVDEKETSESLVNKLQENSLSSNDQCIRYEGKKRFVKIFDEVTHDLSNQEKPWKNNGVYLITGGLGSLGLTFAKEISEKSKNAKLILVGRSELTAEREENFNMLSNLGIKAEYRVVDVSDKEAVDELIQVIEKKFGGLNGVIHSAGIIRDNFILKKNDLEFKQVLSPKVSGAINLDQATAHLKTLDFFVLFSSIAGVLGNVGQADYSTANAFMDDFSQYRNALVGLEKRHGQTLSVNWSLWKNGGMSVDEISETMMRDNFGMIAIETSSALSAFYQGLSLKTSQLVVMEGYLERMRKYFSANKTEKKSCNESSKAIKMNKVTLREKTLNSLKILFGKVIKLEVAKIDTEAPLEIYGINSIVVINMNKELEAIFGAISKTLLFEYQTLSMLVDYFIENYQQACIQWIDMHEQKFYQSENNFSDTSYKDESSIAIINSSKQDKADSLEKTMNANKLEEQIAIIGVSGHYPKAENLEEYWRNLQSGKDCIVEIPKERWPLEEFFHANKEDAIALGKSYSKWGGFLDAFAEFDSLFFNISPREAMSMDPQERLFLQSCWELIEDAGYTKERLALQHNGKVGVFAGITKTGFNLYGPELWKKGEQFYPHTSFSSVANRVSYALNLQGPSMPIDTMCSSSLTAIHEACKYLHLNECEMAIAGGVNLYLHPSTYTALCSQRMLSTNAQCKSFGEGGNGFVPGEGVGVVLLKKLPNAIADNDHIYAVIRSSSVNHGGKTNGYTVPNPNAQGRLIKEALDKAGINARTVSYLEAHGTGTELGDPIEITGLTQAFRSDTQDVGFCAIGSAKSNIGHLEAAAGIAGVTKILLQMKYNKLVPSLHAKRLNPNINFKKTPFIVQQQLSEWKKPMVELDGKIQQFPRIAGVSSFGAGGSNAHIILEQYCQNESEQSKAVRAQCPNPAIIILSAKSIDRLKAYAKKLLDFIQTNNSTINIADLAYTLQIGREAMENRLGMIVKSIKEVEIILQDFIKNKKNIENFYIGKIEKNINFLSSFPKYSDTRDLLETWFSQKKYEKILTHWIKGFTFNWNDLYGQIKPKLISTVTYPFEKRRYWFDVQGSEITDIDKEVIKPKSLLLLQENNSDFSEQCFTSTFTGEDFFTKNYQVNRIKTLPGMVHLEMAYKAIKRTPGYKSDEVQTIQFENVNWSEPIIVQDKPINISIELFLGEGSIVFETYENNSKERSIVYSQGKASLVDSEENPPLKIFELQKKLSQKILDSYDCYSIFDNMNVKYGSAYQGVNKIYVGQGEVLARLILPNLVKGKKNETILISTILDFALQASIGLTNPEELQYKTLQPSSPFSLEELTIVDECSEKMWAWLRYTEKANSLHFKNIKKLDIDLCDDQGRVCITIRGISLPIEILKNRKLFQQSKRLPKLVKKIPLTLL